MTVRRIGLFLGPLAFALTVGGGRPPGWRWAHGWSRG